MNGLSISELNLKQKPQNNNREIAERIAANFGTKPVEITVKMIGTEDIKALFKKLDRAQKCAHKNPIRFK